MIHSELDALLVDVASLKRYPRNPRRGDVAALRDSLERNGQYRPIVVNARTREVLAGNHTLDAARELSWSQIAATYVDVDDDTAARIVLADNRANDLATYDDAELVQLLESLPSLDGTLYEHDDLEALLASLEQPEQSDALDTDDEQPRERYSYGVFEREQIVDAAFAHYRATGFPYRSAPLFECLLEVNALHAMSTDALLRSDVGYRTADTYHAHRWAAHVESKRNALDNFASDKYLRVAIEHTLEHHMGFTPGTFPRVLGITRGAQAVSNFRPGFALHLLRRFAPDDAVVLDASTGYGGRLVGFLASHCSTYIGFDPARETHDANVRLVADLCPSSKRVELTCTPAEDVDVELVRERCDVAFTSPPYFAKERYSDDATQSFRRYPDAEQWREQFLVPLLALQHAALKPGAVSLLNIADVDVAGAHVPLVEWALEAARRACFDVESVERYPLQRRWGPQDDVVATEPVIVLRKP
jgi:hypothetical protein